MGNHMSPPLAHVQEGIKTCRGSRILTNSFNKMNICFVCFLAGIYVVAVEGGEITFVEFYNLGCRGIYDQAKMARLDRLCEECYQLYRVEEILYECRKHCFSSNRFHECVTSVTHERHREEVMGASAALRCHIPEWTS